VGRIICLSSPCSRSFPSVPPDCCDPATAKCLLAAAVRSPRPVEGSERCNPTMTSGWFRP
jgi:hypothetical protein